MDRFGGGEMKILTLIFLELLLLPTLGLAGAGCSDVDLREKIGPPMHQGDSGYCFAHSSSTLIQARLGERVSPMHLATGYLLTNPEELEPVSDPAVRAHLTPEFFSHWRNDRALEPGNYASDKILGESGLLDTGGDEFQTLLVANFRGLCPEARLPTGENVYKDYLREIVSFHQRRFIAPDERNQKIGEIMDPEAREKAWSYRKWVEEKCGATFRPRQALLPSTLSLAPNLKALRRLEMRPLSSIDLFKGRNRVLQEIDRQMDRGNPVAVGYALADLMPDTSIFGREKQPSADQVDHASVIAGRKMSGGRCYYYLRNSFGMETKGYKPRFRGRLQDGGVWILPEELPSLYSAVWLD